jgi:hypothetical protein
MSSKDDEKLLIIINQLDRISKHLTELNERVDRLEGKTNDIHQHVPFVNWLASVGQVMSNKLTWLQNIETLPLKSLEYNSKNNIK